MEINIIDHHLKTCNLCKITDFIFKSKTNTKVARITKCSAPMTYNSSYVNTNM